MNPLKPASADLNAGVARCDITPPQGIYNRMWGAAGDVATGVHRPITATVLALQDVAGPPMLLAAIDWCLVFDRDDLEAFRGPLVALAGGDDARVIVACSHTHALGYLDSSRADMPGGHLIAGYLAEAGTSVAAAAGEAVRQATRTKCTLTWANGMCDLAANRDLPDPTDPGRYVCGFNPAVPADDTVLVGRITRTDTGGVLATLVNYACHPTTLAWENSLLSPDFVGATREIVERHTGGSCLFLQGASGELAPRHQYVGDPAVADGHGRQLGYAVLSALEGMLAGSQTLAYAGVTESGAPLARWRPEPFAPPRTLRATTFSPRFELKSDYTLEQLRRDGAGVEERVLQERLRRRERVLRWTGTASPAAVPVWLWQVGDTVMLAHQGEAYSQLQIELRRRFPHHAVVVMNAANGTTGYFPPEASYDHDLYQVWQTPFARGSLELLIDAAGRQMRKLLESPA